MNVVILSPAGLFDADSLPGASDGDAHMVIMWRRDGGSDDAIALCPASGAVARMVAAAERSVVGRVLVRLTPLDPGVAFWRAARRDDRARGALRDADVLIAPERDGAYAAWRFARAARRRGRKLSAVFGYPAGRAAVEAAR